MILVIILLFILISILVIFNIIYKKKVIYKCSIQSKELYNKYLEQYTKHTHTYNDKSYTQLLYKQSLTEKNEMVNKKALIWVHGYNDYYYQFCIGEKIINEGCDIFAISLRKYIKNEMYLSTNFDEYIEDIDIHIKYILNKYNYEKLFLYGHSVGGLLCTIYMNKSIHKDKINGIILNSPFFELNDKVYTQIEIYIMKNILYYFGYIYPNAIISAEDYKISNDYAKTILDRYYFNTKLKTAHQNFITVGWLKECLYYQNLIQTKKINIQIPILVLCSDKSSTNSNSRCGDSVLNISDIEKYSKYIGENTTISKIKDSTHDVLVSKNIPAQIALNEIIIFVQNN